MHYVGIDWADEKHDIYITNDSGKKLACFEISNDQKGMLKLLAKIQKLSKDTSSILFAMEKSSGPLAEFILDHNYTLYSINPKVVDRYRDRHKVSGAKTDPIDAMVLAHILRTDRHQFRPLLPDSELARKIKLLSRDRDNLVKAKTRILNKLRANLKEYFPAAARAFKNLDKREVIKFLRKYPSHEEAAQLRKEEIKNFFRGSGHSFKKIEKIYSILQVPSIQVPQFIVEAKKRYTLALLAQLPPLIKQIKEYKEEISRLMDKHPEKNIFRTLPGSGDTISARLLGELGDNKERFKDYSSYQCYGGTAPITKYSGKMRRGVKARRACNRGLKQTVSQLAFCSLRRSTWAREYYIKKKKGGYSHSQALVALGNKWLKILFALRKKKEIYKEEFHLMMKEKHRMKAIPA